MKESQIAAEPACGQRAQVQASGFAGFAEAVTAVLGFLSEAVPLSTWMVSRIRNGRYTILGVGGLEQEIAVGDSEPAEGTVCLQMISGLGPNIAPDVELIPAYAEAARSYSFPLRSYIGYPIAPRGGEVFGSLCAIDAAKKDASVVGYGSLVSLMARQLATILDFDLQREDTWRQALLSEARSMTDSLTEVLNRRGWDFVCRREEERARQFAHPLTVVQLDMDGLKRINDMDGHAAGDLAIERLARCLREQLPASAALARTGGDEFSILLPNHVAAEAESLMQTVASALSAISVSASIGWAEREPERGIDVAWKSADAAMYANKQRSHTRRSGDRAS